MDPKMVLYPAYCVPVRQKKTGKAGISNEQPFSAKQLSGLEFTMFNDFSQHYRSKPAYIVASLKIPSGQQ
jgi:hypothetical protein